MDKVKKMNIIKNVHKMYLTLGHQSKHLTVF